MRIAIDGRCLLGGPRTGVGLYAIGLLDALFAQKSEHEYIIFSSGWRPFPEDLQKRWEGKAVFVHTRVPNKLLHACFAFFDVLSIDQMIAKKIGKPIDVLFAPNIHLLPVTDHVRLVLTVHDLSFIHLPEVFSWKRRLWHWMIGVKELTMRADVIITPSQYTAWDVSRTLGKDAKAVVPVIAAHKPDEGSPVSYELPENYVLFLGTIEPRKNIDALLEAYVLSGLHEKGIDLVIAGGLGWKCRRIKRVIDITPGVRHVGYVASEEKQALYAGAQLFVYPSRYEGFGLPVLEAMQAGVPVVTARVTALTEVGGDACWYVHPDDVRQLADGMVKMIEDQRLREEYVQRGRARAAQYQWGRSAEQLLHVFTINKPPS